MNGERRDERLPGDEPRADAVAAPQPRDERGDRMEVTDGEAALVAFEPVRPRRTRAAAEVPVADAANDVASDGTVEETPAPRRRGRPRKVVPAADA